MNDDEGEFGYLRSKGGDKQRGQVNPKIKEVRFLIIKLKLSLKNEKYLSNTLIVPPRG